MPTHCLFKPAFHKKFDQLQKNQQVLVVKTLEALEQYFEKGIAPFGLRIKKLYSSPTAKIFEARINIDLRIICAQEGSEISFALIGNHDEVRRFIRNL